jgi:hypothetical protein
MEHSEETERLAFIRQGKDGMQVEIVGNPKVLMGMLHSAILSHIEVRRLMMPLFMAIMKDDKFMDVAMNDMLSAMKEEEDEDDEDIIDTN